MAEYDKGFQGHNAMILIFSDSGNYKLRMPTKYAASKPIIEIHQRTSAGHYHGDPSRHQ